MLSGIVDCVPKIDYPFDPLSSFSEPFPILPPPLVRILGRWSNRIEKERTEGGFREEVAKLRFLGPH